MLGELWCITFLAVFLALEHLLSVAQYTKHRDYHIYRLCASVELTRAVRSTAVPAVVASRPVICTQLMRETLLIALIAATESPSAQ
jgi:hypothetical protein